MSYTITVKSPITWENGKHEIIEHLHECSNITEVINIITAVYMPFRVHEITTIAHGYDIIYQNGHIGVRCPVRLAKFLSNNINVR